MFKNKSTLFMGLLFSLALSPAMAGDPGDRGFTFLKIAQGPRAAGMGEAQTAVANDSYAVVWNPAGLSRLNQNQLAMTHNRSFQDVQQQHLNGAFHLKNNIVLGLHLTTLSVDSFASYDAGGNEAGSVSATDRAFGFTLAGCLSKRLSAGGGVKFVRSQLGPARVATHAFDAGVLSRLPFFESRNRYLSAGLAVRNLGSPAVYDQEKTKFPAVYSAGLGYDAVLGKNNFVGAVDYNLSPDNDPYVAIGQEFSFRKTVALRCGYRSGKSEEAGFRAGIGLTLKSFDFSYSLAPYGFLGDSHRFGVAFKFGPQRQRLPAKPAPALLPVQAPPTPQPRPAPLPVILEAPIEAVPAREPEKPAVVTEERIVPVIPAAREEKAVPVKKPAPVKPQAPLYKTKEKILQGDAASLIEKGKENFRSGHYYEATVAFGQALRIEPNNKSALEFMRKAMNEMDRKKRREKGIYE